jgi:hypothetical protein
MRFLRGAGTAAFVFLGAMLPVCAQHDEKAGEKKEAPPQHAQQPKPQQTQRAQQPKAAPAEHAQQPKPQPAQRAQQPKAAPAEHAQQPKPQPAQRAQQPKAAQPERAQQAKPQPAQRAQQPKPQAAPQRAQGQAPQQGRQQPQRSTQQAKTWQQQRGWTQQGGGWKGNSSWQGDRSQNWASDHRSWEQRGGYGGYYIPQATFGLSFGSDHFFRLRTQPVIYEGFPRFQYGGFSFLMVDPWPQDWAEDWYANDDVYIDYDDGYYLYNRRFPQERLAITIAL